MPAFENRRVRALRGLAESTGGRFWGAGSDDELRVAFADIAASMRRRYLLRFEPAGGKTGWHRLEVRLKGVKGEVQARPGYWVGAGNLRDEGGPGRAAAGVRVRRARGGRHGSGPALRAGRAGGGARGSGRPRREPARVGAAGRSRRTRDAALLRAALMLYTDRALLERAQAPGSETAQGAR